MKLAYINKKFVALRHGRVLTCRTIREAIMFLGGEK